MITVFGSINADLLFRLKRIPAPGETLLADSLLPQPGGKGANQAVAAARDGAAVRMVGAVGEDALADLALGGLRAAGVDIAGVRVLAGQGTGCASICTDRAGRNQIAVALGANAAVSAAQLDGSLKGGDTLLLQCEGPQDEIEAAIGRGRRAGATVILNLAPAVSLARDALATLDILVVNEDEATALGAMLGTDANAAALRRTLGVTTIRTLGASGAEVADGSGVRHVPASRIKARDTTAAGDCFVGVLASGLQRELDLAAATDRAVVAASLACLREGSQSSLPHRAETDGAMR